MAYSEYLVEITVTGTPDSKQDFSFVDLTDILTDSSLPASFSIVPHIMKGNSTDRRNVWIGNVTRTAFQACLYGFGEEGVVSNVIKLFIKGVP